MGKHEKEGNYRRYELKLLKVEGGLCSVRMYIVHTPALES